MDMNRLHDELDRLVKIMETLRGPEGCPWDKKQDYHSLQAYIIEEAYELVEAIQLEDMDLLRDELGDLFLQVVFQAQIAREEGEFNLADVVNTISEKLIRRHPHVFASEKVDSVEEVRVVWEEIKKQEKSNRKGKVVSTIMEDVSRNQAALSQAYHVQKKAADLGFDWDDIKDVINKVKEELNELEESIVEGNDKEMQEEMGDLIFSAVNLARFLKVNPEIALLNTILKFKSRFAYIETSLLKEGKSFEEMTLQELDDYWEEAKKLELRGGV
ncbi:nucleoside triphosphate pyrophosphohydrolase [Natronospora cellulosivora (SeqCode)]